MDIKKLKSILQDALEDELPASQIDLLPAVQARLIVRNTAGQGESMNRARNRKLALSTLIGVATLTIVTLTTPQGRAFAQNLLQFFTRAESDTLPLQPWQLTPFPTPTISVATLSIANAEEQVGFDARELIALPEKLTLQGARVEENIMYIDYTLADDCRFTLAQTLNDLYPNASLWSQFSAGDIQKVKIGEFDGELAHDFSSTPPVMRVRWQQPDDGFPPPSDMSFSNFRPGILSLELTAFCTPGSAGYIDEEGLLDLAQRTVHTNWVDSLVKLEQAEHQVGFSALQLPEDNAEVFTLVGANVDPQYRLLMLIYRSPDGSGVQSGRSLSIKQWPITEPLETCDLCAAIGASAEVITISVRGTTGEYMQGVWSLTNMGPVWEPVPHQKIIRWQEAGYWFELGMSTADGSHAMEDLIAVAESLK